MHHFQPKDGLLYAEDVPVTELVERFGSPLYVYSAATFRRHFQQFDSAFADLDHMVCFSVKANGNVHVLKMLAEQGAGMDIVSGGELHRALAAGVEPKKIVYSGVGKTEAEIRYAVEQDILMFNVESLPELEEIERVAGALGRKAGVSLRINPDVDPKTHPYISTGMKNNKFGLEMGQALEGYRLAQRMEHVEPIGVDCHIGSQLTTIEPFMEALDKVLDFEKNLRAEGIGLRYIDLGGGLGITYNEEAPPHPKEFGAAIVGRLKNEGLKLILEPGRVISGNAGVLLTKVTYVKKTPFKNFIIVDAAMNDLVRPSLYQSYHRITPAKQSDRPEIVVDVVGPICESGDFLAKERSLPEVEAGEILAVFSAGAYGFTMSSNYNARLRAAEVIVDGDKTILARRRETYEDLVRGEL
ncbi:MAG: diaminopimelate decarboxylase [Desulfovibrionaceae bacterium]